MLTLEVVVPMYLRCGGRSIGGVIKRPTQWRQTVATEAPKTDDRLLQDMIDERLGFVEPLDERIGIPAPP